MNYQIELTKEAESDLLYLHNADQKFLRKIVAKIESLSKSPYEGKPLVGNHKGEYSLRIGSYRIIYMVDTGKHIVYILTVKHRKSVY